MRDYLNAHEDRAAYTNGKAMLIEDILRCAEEWRKQDC